MFFRVRAAGHRFLIDFGSEYFFFVFDAGVEGEEQSQLCVENTCVLSPIICLHQPFNRSLETSFVKQQQRKEDRAAAVAMLHWMRPGLHGLSSCNAFTSSDATILSL